MNTTVRKHRKNKSHLHIYRRPYPNAADPYYRVNRIIDAALAVVTGLGSVSAFLFLATM